MDQVNSYLGCNVSLDREFGPAVNCEQFDFTLTFEQSILGIGISGIFLLLIPRKAYQLYGASIKTLNSPVHKFKIGISFAILGLQIASLVLWAKLRFSQVAIAAAALSLVAILAVCGLTIFEHSRTIRPSTWICLYLLSSITTDSVQLRTLYLRKYDNHIAAILSAIVAGKLVLLFIESLSKHTYLRNKEYGPEETTGIVGRSVFWWLNSLFWVGRRKVLSKEDLYPLDQELHSTGLRERMLQTWKKNKKKASRPLLHAILSCFRLEIFLTVLPRAATIGFRYSQAFLITAAVKYLGTRAEQRDRNHAYGLIGAAGIIYFGEPLVNAEYSLKLYRFQTAFRGSMVSLIYSKLLSSKSDFKESQPVTLMTTDIEQTSMGLNSGIEIWALLVEVGIGIWLLWMQLGPSAIAPILVVTICTFSQGWFSRNMGPMQGAWVGAVQSRVGVASTVLSSIKSIKLAGLTNAMGDLLQAERKTELKLAKKFRWRMVATTCIANIPGLFSPLIVFAAFAIESAIRHTPPLSTAKAFSSLAIVMLLTQPAVKLLNSFPPTIAALGCLKRIETFLQAEDFQDPRSDLSTLDHRSDVAIKSVDLLDSNRTSEETAVSVSHMVLKPEALPEATVSSINFSMRRGAVTMILGPVGSGKSTLLKAVLGEISSQSGSASRIGITSPFMAYCSQTPWLQNTSVRKTIIGPNRFEKDWYEKVVWLCELDEDISQMPNRDLSEIGSRGVTLSGGQRHRIALARALYSRCPIIVLDDFVASLDPATRKSIARKLFSNDGYTKRHQCTVLLATHEESFAAYADDILVLDQQGHPEYFGTPSNWRKFEFNVEDEDPVNISYSLTPKSSTAQEGADPPSPKIPSLKSKNSTDVKRQTGDIATWFYYSKAVGLWPLILLAFFIVITSLGVNFPKLLLKWSTEQNFLVGEFVGLFTMISVLTWVCQNAMVAQMLISVATQSAMNLHKILVTATLRAPMSFFEITDSGVLLNRFSQDMSMVDLAVPVSIFAVILSFSSVISQAAFLCIGSSYMAATVPVAIIAVYGVQKFYLRTSRQLRLLELEYKSPLYSQFTETMEGLLTIRAFGWQNHFETIELQSLDDSQRPVYLLLCIQRWLNLVLGLVSAGIGTIVIALAVLVPQSSSAGSLGVALTSVLGFTQALEGFISSYTGAETTIGSVTRTRDFEKETPQEDSGDELHEPGVKWPQGGIRFSNVTVVYGNGKFGMRNVSFDIKEGQKFGIVGRTGSGKSTLLSTLLRLMDPTEGTIQIDGLDISRIPGNIVRDRLICIPQDPLIFAKTFQFNLDPNGQTFEPKAIENVLDLVGLRDLVHERGGLSAKLDPAALSLGEQQLLILARSILRKRASTGKCILILDEATSSMDSVLQTKIQEIVAEEFKDNTVITVSHRLDFIRDCDFVVVLENGEVARIGVPIDVFVEE